MPVAGWATGGTSTSGQSRVYRALPWANYQSVSDWLEELVDAVGGDFDIWWDRFVGSRFDAEGESGRLNLVDLDRTVSESASASLASAIAAPSNTASADTVLDILLYLAGVPWPVDGNWTTQQKRELVRVGWDALRKKATRRALLRLMAGPMSGVIYGANMPPWTFSFIHGDTEPSPGYGTWSTTPVTKAGAVDTTLGSATVTGASTSFVTDGSWNGLIIIIEERAYWISSVTSATQLTLTANAAETIAGVSYAIVYPPAVRPWLFEATDNATKRVAPGWADKGVGYSQFRVGFSAVGEPVMAEGARINLLLNGSFADFSSATPDNWTTSGSATLARGTFLSSPSPQINHEFSSHCAQLRLAGAGVGVGRYLTQSATVNNRAAHRFALEYAYYNAQQVSTLTVEISDQGNSAVYYWPAAPTLQAGTVDIVEGSTRVAGTGTAFDTTGLWSGMPLTTPSNRLYLIERVESATSLILRDVALFDELDTAFSVKAWTTSATTIPVPPHASSLVERLAYTCDVHPLRASGAAAVRGTASIQVKIGATSDATTTTAVTYTLYSVALYEKHDPVIEDEALSERTLWLPLIDALGWSQKTRAGSDTLIEIASASRSAFKSAAAGSALFDYHPALGARGYRSSSAWTNAITQSNTFSSWTLASATYDGTGVSPDLAASPILAGLITASSTANTAERSSGTTAASKSWLYGIWAKSIAADQAYQAGTITITAGSASVTGSGTSFTSAWDGAELKTAAGNVYKISSVGGATALTLSAVAGRTETAVQYKIADFKVSLLYGTTEGDSSSFFRTQADGWTLLAAPVAALGAVAGNVGIRVRYLGRASGQYALCAGYAYDVTGKTDVLYPPVCLSGASAGTVNACYLDAITDNIGTDVKSELLKTALVSVSRGVLAMTVVPVFGATSCPDATILDVCQSGTANRLRLHIASGAITLTRINDAGTSTSMSLTLTTSDAPTATQATWKRDTAIPILIRWDDDGKASMSVGDSSVTATLSAAPYTDTSVDTLRLGATEAGAGNFDGSITLAEFCQVGTPTI